MRRSTLVLALLVVACGSRGECLCDAATPAGDAGHAMCAAPGAPTPGAADTHCAPAVAQPTHAASCGGHGAPDAGVASCEFGTTVFGATEGDDDDCKYHFAWTSTPICEGTRGVFFTVVVTSRADGSAVTRADLRAEAFVSTGDACDTASPLGADTFVAFQEGTTGEFGTYTGVVPFDQPGQWTVRFHVFPACDDTLPDSPRGHIAFRLTVP